MPADEAGAATLSRRLWMDLARGTRTDSEISGAAERLTRQLHAGLSQWIGVEGYRTLQERARREMMVDHPILAKLSFGTGDVVGLANAIRDDGRDALAEGMVALTTRMIELLGRIIGVEMGLRLVEHSGDRPRAGSRSTTGESSNG